jgi:hypothetical protein
MMLGWIWKTVREMGAYPVTADELANFWKSPARKLEWLVIALPTAVRVVGALCAVGRLAAVRGVDVRVAVVYRSQSQIEEEL